MVAENDMYLQASWGEVQFVAKGGLVTFMGDEAIGNNNPCDMVIANGDRKGNRVLTASGYEIRKDLENSGVELSDGAKKFCKWLPKKTGKTRICREEKAKIWKICNLCPAAVSGCRFALRAQKAVPSVFGRGRKYSSRCCAASGGAGRLKSEASGSCPEAFAGWKTAFVISFFLTDSSKRGRRSRWRLWASADGLCRLCRRRQCPDAPI